MTATVFGWCSANQHYACPQHAPGQATPLVCSCPCHEKPSEAA